MHTKRSAFGRSQARELLDGELFDRRELAANLADLRVANRWFGGTASVLRALHTLLRGQQVRRPLRVLDVATGSGDGALAMAQWGRKHGWPLQVYGSDLLVGVLAEARKHTHGQVPLLRHDALHLPCAPGTLDVVVCAQTLHHFDPAAAITLLRELAQAARLALIVCDLARSWPSYAGARALSLTQRSAMSRYDGPLSAQRAYTPAEVLQLAHAAELCNISVRRDGPFRLTLIARHAGVEGR